MSKKNSAGSHNPCEEKTDLFDDSIGGRSNAPVTCLGITFENDKARRVHFAEELHKKLQDADFRKIEGFPIGSDEDILNLSDPPYYTACPNPWINDFISEWEAQKPEQPEAYYYHREPFAANVSEGKNDPIYNAHSYHTKVPYKAIMRYILHYTEPGDIVFDGFCGTGMTGVAAQTCGNRKAIMSLGYQVESDGTILQEGTDTNGKKIWQSFSKLGVRRAVLNDLSPAATFIAYNYNTSIDVAAFERESQRILKEVEDECGWMYETKHSDGRVGKINYTVWSDVFVCPECTNEVVFWDEAVDQENGKVRDNFPCPKCRANLSKRSMERAWTTRYDSALNQSVKQTKQIPVMINYTVLGSKDRCEKTPDDFDIALIDKIDNSRMPYWFPTNRMMEGKEARRNDSSGITHVHQFYTKRNLWVLAKTLKRCSLQHKIIFQSITATLCSRLVRYNLGKRGNGPLNGTLYISSLNAESEITKVFLGKSKVFAKAFIAKENNIVQLQSCKNTPLSDESVDYLFFDPPFGANLNYSELNFIWESWLKVRTNNKPEAIENSVQGKGPSEYRQLMTGCFKEAYRVLKPGRWITVEFSNTKASVWNSIQSALNEAGFIVSNVSALDKKQGSFKAVTTPTAVKQDLVISAYKPNGGFEERFLKEAQTEESVWDFIRTHLGYLLITKQRGTLLQFVPERTPRILFDQVIAYYVRKGYVLRISSKDFQIGLAQRFVERDGMFFLPDQVVKYDRKKMASGELTPPSLFVSDEASVIQWLRQHIQKRPQTFSDINPQFMQQLSGWSKNEAQLDLRELLNQNFLCYDGKSPVPEQIHAYLSTNWKGLRNLPKDAPSLVAKACDRWYIPDPNKADDLEKLREKALLKEFEEYKRGEKKLKVFRLEAVRTGFKRAWRDRDYDIIIAVAEKLPSTILEEDPKLLMWYDQAVTRKGEG
ncbi:MAG: DNA methylase [Alphaproteobacteria bacterium]|nr:DNA methylase [Alphaproteobacteria bacterium]